MITISTTTLVWMTRSVHSNDRYPLTVIPTGRWRIVTADGGDPVLWLEVFGTKAKGKYSGTRETDYTTTNWSPENALVVHTEVVNTPHHTDPRAPL